MAERRLRVLLRADARPFITSMTNAQRRMEQFAQAVVRSQHIMAAATTTSARTVQASYAGMGTAAAAAGTAVAASNRGAAASTAAVGASVGRMAAQTKQGTQRAGRAYGSLAAGAALGSKKMVSGFKDASKHGDAMHGRFENYAGFVGFQMLGRQAIVMGAMIAGALGLATREFARFEDTFALVRKTTQATEVAYQALSAEIRELATQVPIAVTELNEVAGVAGQLGVPTEDIAAFTEVMAQMGVATNVTSEEAALFMARIAAVMDLDYENDIKSMGAATVDLGNNFAAREDEILRFTQRISAAGAVMGMTTADLLGFATAASSVGIRVEMGGTALMRVMFMMNEAVNEGAENLELLAETSGITGEEFATLWGEDATEAMLMFIDGIGGMGSEAEAVLKALFGRNVRTTQTMLALGQASEQTREAVGRGNRAWDEQIALTAEAEERFGTFINRLRVFGNRIKDVAISIGERMAPAIEAAMRGVVALIELFGKLPKPIQDFGMVMATLAAATALVAGNMLLMVFPLRVLQGMLPQLVSGWRAATGGAQAYATATAQATGATGAATAMVGNHTRALTANQTAAWLAAETHMRKVGVMAHVRHAHMRAGSALHALGQRITGAAKAVAPFLAGMLKLVAAAAVIYAVFRGGMWLWDKMRGEMIDTGDAAEQVALSMDRTLTAFEGYADGADGAAEKVATFREHNQELIDTLRNMPQARAESAIWRIAVEMQQRGADPEEVEEAVKQLSRMASVPIDFDINFGDADQVAEQLRNSVSGIIASLPEGQTPIFGRAALQDLREFGQIIGATGDTQGMVRTIEELDARFDSVGVTIRRSNDFMSEFIMSFGQSGAEIDQMNQAWEEATKRIRRGEDALTVVNGTLREFALIAADTGNLEGARLWLDTLEQQGISTRGVAIEVDRANHAQSAMVETTKEATVWAGNLDAEMDDLGDTMEEASGVMDQFTKATEAAIKAIGEGWDPLSRYGELLDELNEKNKEAAQATAEATGDSKASWEDYFNETEASFSLYMQSLNETLENQRKWHENLNTIRKAAGDDYANYLASLGPQHADLIAAIAAAEEAEIQEAAETHNKIRWEAAEEAINIITSQGKVQVDETGRVSRETVEELADQLGTSTDVIDAIFDQNNAIVQSQLDRMAEIAGEGTFQVVDRIVRQLGLGAEDVARVVNQYSKALADGLNPVIASVEGTPIVASNPSDVGLYRLAARRGINIGGGRGDNFEDPNIPLSSSVSARSRIDLQPTGDLMDRADGGFWSTDDVPEVPATPTSGAIGQAGTESMTHTREAALEWLEENLAPQIDLADFPTGAGDSGLWRRLWGAVSGRFPGVRLHSAYRPGAITATGNRSYHGMGRAIDITPSMAIADWIRANYMSQTRELIFSPMGQRQIHNGRNHVYSGITKAMHYDHIHWAMAKGGIVTDPTLALIGEAGPEIVIPLDRWKEMHEGMFDQWLLDFMRSGKVKSPSGEYRDLFKASSGLSERGTEFKPQLSAEIFAAAGNTARDLENAISLVNVMMQEQNELIQARALHEREAALVAEVNAARARRDAATEKEERKAEGQALTEAWANLREFRREQELASRQRVIQEQIARAEMELTKRRNMESIIVEAMTQERRMNHFKQLRDQQEKWTDEWMAAHREYAQARDAIRAEQRQRDENRRTLEFERMTTQEQIKELEKRLKKEQEYSNEWMQIHRDLEQRRQELLDLEQRKKDNKESIRFEEATTEEQIKTLEKRMKAYEKYTDEWTAAYRQHRDLVQRQTEELKQELESQRQALRTHASALGGIHQRVQMQWGASTKFIISNMRSQIEVFDEHAKGMQNLAARGISADMMEALGLDDPKNLHQMRMLLRATDEEIQDLIKTFGQHEQAAQRSMDTIETYMGEDARLATATVSTSGSNNSISVRQFDSGGELPPGLTMAVNRTGKAEYVLRPSRGSKGQGEQVHVVVPTIVEIDGKEVARTVTHYQKRDDRFIRIKSGQGNI